MGGDAGEFGAIEVIAACERFLVNVREVGIDRGAARGTLPKPVELRMTPIADRVPTQYLAREQRLTPQRDQALGVQVLRVQRPEAQS